MNRTTIALSSILAAGVLLAACGGDDDSTTPAMPGTEENMPDEDMPDDDMSGMDDHEDEGISPVAEGARRVEVVAGDFGFDPDEITAEPGEDLAIALTSEDILHDFTIDELDAHVAADAGETAEGGISDLEPGTYTYYCSVPGHREAGMEGTLTVE
jgi:plastocyanin